MDTDLPLHDWGFDEATNTVIAQDVQTLIADIPALGPTNDLTVDVTSIVTGWVDGSLDNYGLVLFIDELEAQGAAFSNAELIASVATEPSTVAMLSLSMLGLISGQRRTMR